MRSPSLPHPARWRSLAVVAVLAAGAVAVAPAPLAAALPTPAHATWSQRAHAVNAANIAFGVGHMSRPDIDTYAALLRQGWTPQRVMTRIPDNDWWRGTLVDDAYVAVLGRHPSAASSIARVNELAAGGTRARLYASLYSSSEFFHVVSHSDVPTFLDNLYRGVLNHPPNAEAVAAWSGRLAAGWPRTAVVDTIIGSAEARGVRVDAAYTSFLHRLPSPSVRAMRAAALAGSTELDLDIALASSPEFFAVAQTVPLPSGTRPPPDPPATKAGAAIHLAQTQLGLDYIWGGETPGVGFDCSGLVQWAWALAGVIIPRTTYIQVLRPTAVPLSKIQPGDLVFYYDSGHVAMYVGDGIVIHAPSTGDIVRYGSLYMVRPEHVVRPT